MRLEAEWTPSLDEFRAFAALTGDENPIHTNPDYAANHPFGAPVSHGMLIHAKLCALGQQALGVVDMVTLTFPAPAYAGVPLTLRIEGEGAHWLATASRPDGTLVCRAVWQNAKGPL